MLTTILLGACVTAAAAFLGGLTGFGYALVATPLLLLLGLDLPVVVAANMALGLLARLLSAVTFRHDIRLGRVGWMLLGTAPGIVAGIGTVSVVDSLVIRRLVGVLVIVSALVLMVAPAIRRQGNSVVTLVGFLGGLIGMTTSLNGIPPAVLYACERTPPRQFVADLAGYFIASNFVIGAIAFMMSGAKQGLVLVLVLTWAPCVLGATWLSNILNGALPIRVFRWLVCLVVLAGGASVLAS